MIYEVYLKFTFTRITLLSQWLFRPLRHHANLPESRVKKPRKTTSNLCLLTRLSKNS